MLDGKFKVTVPGFEEHEYCHRIECRVQKMLSDVDDEASPRYQPRNVHPEQFTKSMVVDSSPFYINNLWPFEAYRIRARYKSTLFPERNGNKQVRCLYQWSKWHHPFRLKPAPLNFYDADDQKENGRTFTSTVERFDHEQLCEWVREKFFGSTSAVDPQCALPGPQGADGMVRQTSIPLITPDCHSEDEEVSPAAGITSGDVPDVTDLRRITSARKSKKIWSTEHERERVFPLILKVLRKSKLKGLDIVLREPREYVVKLLMPIHRQMVADGESNDDEKEAPKRPRKADPERDALRLSIIELIRTESLVNKQVDSSMTDKELDSILNMRLVQSLLTKKGMKPQEIRVKLFGRKSLRSSARYTVLTEGDFESVLWRLRQSSFMEAEHPVGALIDNPYCIYLWVFFLKKPRLHYAVQQSNDNVFVPLRPCLGTSEVHLFYGKYFARTDPLEVDMTFYLCEKNSETHKFAWLKVDGEMVKFQSTRRRHIVIRAYNKGVGSISAKDVHSKLKPAALQQQAAAHRDDMVQKVKDMKDWKSLLVSKNWSIGGKQRPNLPYFECLLQFCFKKVGQRVPLSACIDVVERMMMMQTGKGKADEGLEMVTEKVEAQKQWVRRLNDDNDRSWLRLIQFLFHLYWIPITNDADHTELFDASMRTMDVLQQLLNGEYGPPKRVICVLGAILKPAAEEFIVDIIRAIDRTQQDLSRRYQYLLWYNLINSVCLEGNYPKQPKLAQEVEDFKFEAEFIRMIQIDVNISAITNVQRMQPLEKEGFWILANSLRRAKDQHVKFQIYNKMCCILSVYQSTGYSDALIKYKAEIMLILKGQKRSMEASIAMLHQLQPTESKDVDALVDLVAEFVRVLDPSQQKNAVYKLVELMGSSKPIARHSRLIESILKNTRIRWREELVPLLVPTLRAQQSAAVRAEVFDEFWLHYDLLKVVRVLVGEHKLPIETFNEMVKVHSKRISKEYFDDWLQVIVDKNVRQPVKLDIAKKPPTTFRGILSRANGDEEHVNKALDKLEETLLTAPPDDDSHKPLMFYYKDVVCKVMMESFLKVDSHYFNCHDSDIDSIEMVNYFYGEYGMHCVMYCHRLMQHERGSSITYCDTLLRNFKRWWQAVKAQIAEAQLEKKIIDQLIDERDVYKCINSMYLEVGGTVDQVVDSKVAENIAKYKDSVEIEDNLKQFFVHFAPDDQSMWDWSIKELYSKMRSISGMNIKRVMKMDWSWYAPYRYSHCGSAALICVLVPISPIDILALSTHKSTQQLL